MPKRLMKIVIIYEFHQMSPEAQMALRSIMEDGSHKMRFMFVTEDHSHIIQPIQSRCTPLQLRKLTDKDIHKVLMRIVKKEGIIMEDLREGLIAKDDSIKDSKDHPKDDSRWYNDELFELIKVNADGDIRIAVNLLQLLSKGKCSKDWYNILGIPEIGYIRGIIEDCREGRGGEACYKVKRLLDEGFDINDLVDLLARILIKFDRFDGHDDFLRSLAHDMLRIEECYSDVQLYSLINHLAQIGQQRISKSNG